MAKRRKLQQAPRSGKSQHKPKLHGQTGGGTKNSTPSQQQQPRAKKQHKQQQHEQPTIPFRPHDRILLIGEGDLSFAASIIQHHGCTNVTATVLEGDHAELVAKYPAVDANIAVIDRRPDPNPQVLTDNPNPKSGSGSGTESDADTDPGEDDDDAPESEPVSDSESDSSPSKSKKKKTPAIAVNNKLIYGVDATKLPSSITRIPHDHIIFNFPHVGGKSTDVNRQVRYNQELLVSFFQRALSSPASPLAPGGDIVITLFEAEPYTLWNIRDLGRHAGLQVDRSFRFQADAYPGYRHARTLGVVKNKKGEEGGGWRGEERAARSYVFVRKGEAQEVGKKRRRNGDDSSSEEDD